MKRNTQWAGLALAATLAALTLLIGANADSASAKSDIYQYDSFPSSTQAGGHPDIFTEFELGSRLTAVPPVPCYCNDPKIVINHLPAGVIANPHVVSECKIAQLALFECPADSQAGIVALKLFGYGGFPLFRVTPSKSQAAVFAFLLPFGAAAPQYLEFSARTGSDYGLDVEATGISHLLPLPYIAPIFWGVPGDHFYDLLRFRPGEKEGFQLRSQSRSKHWPNTTRPCSKSSVPTACPVERRPLLSADRADEPEPDDLRRTARLDDRCLLVRPRVDARAVRLAGDDWVRRPELRPEPRGKPDHD